MAVPNDKEAIKITLEDLASVAVPERQPAAPISTSALPLHREAAQSPSLEQKAPEPQAMSIDVSRKDDPWAEKIVIG